MIRIAFALPLLFVPIFPSVTVAQTVYRVDIRNAQAEILRDHLHLGGSNPRGEKIAFNSLYMEGNGKPRLPVMGEFHYARYPEAYWDESLRKMKAGGVNMVSTYVFWNMHEEVEGQFDWSGSRSLRHFIELCGKNDLQAIVRVGPFCHGEIRNGGLPDWLYGRPFNVRSNDPGYLHYVQRLYREIAKQLAGLLYKDGGPVVGIQLENEYQHSGAPWAFSYPGEKPEWTIADEKRYFVLNDNSGKKKNSYSEEGQRHMALLKQFAQEAGLVVPLYTVTGWGNAATIPDGAIPVTSAYPYPTWSGATPSPLYLYQDLHARPDYAPVSYQPIRYPSFGAELGGGIMVTYSRRPTVSANSLVALVVRELGSGANAIGYYMYHGGATPRGEHSFLSDEAAGVPKISYDFQAPIGQYGQPAESYRHLKPIHFFLNDFGSLLAPMVTVLPENASQLDPADVDQLRFAVRSQGDTGFVFVHNFQDHVPNHDLENVQISVQTRDETLRIPASRGMMLKSETSAVFPFNVDFGGVRIKSATAQPLACLSTEGGLRYAFMAIDGIQPQFVIDAKTVRHVRSANCQIESQPDRSIVTSGNDPVAEFSVENSKGEQVTFTVFPTPMAQNAWLIELQGGKRLVFSNSIVLRNNNLVEFDSLGTNNIEFSVYPALSAPPHYHDEVLSSAPPPHPSMSSYRLAVPELEPFVHAKVADRRTLTLSTDRATLPDGVNDVFLEVDYTGDVGLAFINGQLVDDHFYFGQPWRLGLKRFFPQLADAGMYFSFRPISKDAPFLPDLPPAAVPEFSKQQEVLHLNHVNVLPEYRVLISF